MIDVMILKWRTGRKLGRTIYAVINEEEADQDFLIGIMDDRDYAEHVVAVHNASLSA